MTAPLFSVLIANYNNGKFLIEALQSVFRQTYTHWEIVIVDDGSTDEQSRAIYASQSTDERIRIFYNDMNMGCGYTKRRCVELAKGELCGFLDPDDVLSKDALMVMVNAFAENSNASLVYSTHYICDEFLNVKSVNSLERYIPQDTDYLHYYGSAVAHFVAFSREKYNQTTGIDAKFRRAVDQDLYLKMEEQGDLVYVPQALYYYRFHENNISLNENANKALYWYVVAIQDACKRRGIESETEQIVAMLIWHDSNYLREQVKELRLQYNMYQHPHFKQVLKVIYRWICRK